MTTDDRSGLVPTIRIPETAIRAAQRQARKVPDTEVGGILVGWWEGSIVAVIQALLVVPDSRAGTHHYQRRRRVAQHVLDDYAAGIDDDRVGYIGEWHTHPAPQPPSSTDRKAIKAIARSSSMPVAMVVLATRRDGQMDVHGAFARGRSPRTGSIAPAHVERIAP